MRFKVICPAIHTALVLKHFIYNVSEGGQVLLSPTRFLTALSDNLSSGQGFLVLSKKHRHSGRACPGQGLPESRLHGWFGLAIHGLGYPHPGGYDELAHNLTK